MCYIFFLIFSRLNKEHLMSDGQKETLPGIRVAHMWERLRNMAHVFIPLFNLDWGSTPLEHSSLDSRIDFIQYPGWIDAILSIIAPHGRIFQNTSWQVRQRVMKDVKTLSDSWKLGEGGRSKMTKTLENLS